MTTEAKLSPTATSKTPRATAWGPVLAMSLALPLLIALMATAFAWPAVNSAPRNVPVALVAPAAASAQIEGALAIAQPGAIELQAVDSVEAARAAIESREVYGALIVGPEGITALTAPGASPVVATTIEGIAQQVGTQMMSSQGIEAPSPSTAEIVVPSGPGDPRGGAFASLAMPIVLGSLMIGSVTTRVTGLAQRLTQAAVASVGAGLAIALIGGTWLGVFAGSFWAIGAVASLGLAAGSVLIIGAHQLAGYPGLATAAGLIMLLGNPLSGAASAPALLPAGWAEIGQALPPGATIQALRSVAFFDGAAAGGPLLILGAWIAAGLLLAGLGAFLKRSR